MGGIELVTNTELSPQDRGDTLVRLVGQGEIGLDSVLSLIHDEEPYVRSCVARSLPHFSSERRIFSYLMELLCDPELHVRGDAVVALGESRDSRATFPLFNYFGYVPYELQKRVLIALGSLRDPRAVCFLKECKNKGGDLGDLALGPYIDCVNSHHFLYSFIGKDDDWRRALQTEGRIDVTSASVLDQNLGVLKMHGWERPQTYVVNDTGFYIGGLIDEHVQVARGGKVLAAGEITFNRVSGQWFVSDVNNRSTGYFPDPKSFVYVANALKKAGILYNGTRFTETFPRGGFCDEEFLVFHPFFGGVGLKHR